MVDRDQRVADDGADRDGGGEAEARWSRPSVEDCSDSESDSDGSSWLSEGAAADLADDAVGVAPAEVGVVALGLGDPRRVLGPAPTFGNVAVANSSDVQFGNKTFFNGPVTIKQVVYAKDAEGAVASAVPAAGSGTTVAHVDPACPGSHGVVAEGVRVTVRPPVVVANGKACANGAAASGSSGSLAGADCCQIPGFSGADKAGDGDGAPRQWWRRLWELCRRHHKLLCTLAVLMVLAGAVMSMVGALGDRLSASTAVTPHMPELPKPWDTVETNVTLHFVPRREWLAQPRLGPVVFLQLPVPIVVISHSATETCDTQATCTHHIRFLQTYHIESKGWSDIIYNFLVGGDGSVYEGRGWTVVGAHTFGYDNRSIGINIVGTFSKVLPSEVQMLALRELIEVGVEAGYIAEDYKLLGHCQLAATESPGARLYEELKTWPHWSPGPDSPVVVHDSTSLK